MADGYDSPRIRSDSVHKRKACCYYVTGHGYGHATRAIGIMGELLSRGYLVNIISALNSDFFLKNIPLSDQNRSHLTYIQRCIDSGAIQSDPISVDSVITLRNYYQNIHSRYDELLAKEIMFLKIQSIDVVLVDASPIACSAAKACNIPSIIISNFTWSFIYENLLPNTAHLLTDTEVENFSDMVVQCNIDTANADYVLLLPGETDMPFAYAGNIIPSPLVHRRPMNSKEDVRRNLNIPMDAYMVVLGFGGHKLTAADFRDEMLPHNWVCVVLQANGLVFDSPRFIGVSNDAYVPDLVAAADVVSCYLVSHYSLNYDFGIVNVGSWEIRLWNDE